MKQPINRFLVNTLLFVIPIFIFFEILFRLGFYPVVTTSTLFDSKMIGVQKRHIKKITLLSIGSSVALYELNSKIIVQNFKIPYYNLASWNLQITDTRNLLNSFVKKYDPKYVILCSSIGDFISAQNNSYSNYLNTNNYIKDNFPEFFYFKNYTSIHQVIRRKFITYPLVSDNWGGALLNKKQQDINREKWDEHNIFPTKYTPENYHALDSLAAFLERQKVKLVFVQAPIKKSYANTSQAQQIIQSHFDRCKAIIERHGGAYLNYYNATIFTDSLFIDEYHLRDAGSIILTMEIVGDLKKILH